MTTSITDKINTLSGIIRNLVKTIFLIMMIFSFTSCKDVLEVEPIDAVSDEETIVDKNSAENAVRGAYRSLANARYYGSSFQFAVLMSGNVLSYTQSGTGQLQFQQHTITADNNEVAAMWAGIYKTINITNHIITKLPGVNDYNLSSALKNQLLGEAYFIRALCYFDLARTWGSVQIFLTPTQIVKDKLGVKRSSREEVFAQVLSDLNKAESLLPATTVRNRATAKTAKALRARFFLYQKQWSRAEADASAIIADSVNYKLVKPYNTFFTKPNTTESVFELSYSAAFPNSLFTGFRTGGNYFANDSIKVRLTNPSIGGSRSSLLNTTGSRALVTLYPSSNGSDPTYLIRTAELYLIRAEARAELNNIEGALSDLNAVRKRADVPASNAATREELLLAIENERAVEFAFEPHRWFDLVRTDRADEILGVKDPNKYVWPIPAPDRFADPALDQNPGY